MEAVGRRSRFFQLGLVVPGSELTTGGRPASRSLSLGPWAERRMGGLPASGRKNRAKLPQQTCLQFDKADNRGCQGQVVRSEDCV